MPRSRRVSPFALWTTLAALVAIAVLIVAVVWSNTARTTASPKAVPSSARIAADGAFSVGSGAHTVATYIDFFCPHCQAFENAYAPQLADLAAANRITLEIHPVAILDGRSQGSAYSTRAAGAFYCVAEDSPDAALPFANALFANQPSEGTPGLSDERLASLASEAGAPGARSCIATRRYDDFVTSLTASRLPADPSSGRKTTPTVTIDERFTPLGEIDGSKTYFIDRFGG